MVVLLNAEPGERGSSLCSRQPRCARRRWFPLVLVCSDALHSFQFGVCRWHAVLSYPVEGTSQWVWVGSRGSCPKAAAPSWVTLEPGVRELGPLATEAPSCLRVVGCVLRL